jgi:hypothetical protein
MASARVEHLLDEITRLSAEEQAELLRDLPRVLQHGRDEGGQRGGPTMDAVKQAIETRERVRQRLATMRQSPGSVNDDLEEVRNGRLEELVDDGVGVPEAQAR